MKYTTFKLPTKTKQRKYKQYSADNCKFTDWIRKQPQLDSYKGIRAYDIDLCCWNKETNQWFLIEVKDRMATPAPDHLKTIEIMDQSFRLNKHIKFMGTFLIQFEGQSPTDSVCWITRYDGTTWSKSTQCFNEKELLLFLLFCFGGQL